MTIAFYPPTKGGTMKTRSLLMQPSVYRNALRAKQLANRDGAELYDCVVAAMTARYGLDMDTILSLGEAADKCSTALRLLDDGMPTDYILAMGVQL